MSRLGSAAEAQALRRSAPPARSAPVQVAMVCLARPRLRRSHRCRPADGASPVRGQPLRRVFEFQAVGDFAAASREAERLQAPAPRPGAGTPLVAARRPAHAGELQAWLSRHGDHPDAARIHALLGRCCRAAPPCRRRPTGPKPVARPFAHAEERDPPERGRFPQSALDRAVRERAQAGNADAALALVEGAAHDAGLRPPSSAPTSPWSCFQPGRGCEGSSDRRRGRAQGRPAAPSPPALLLWAPAGSTSPSVSSSGPRGRRPRRRSARPPRSGPRARRHPRAPAGALHSVDDAGGAGIAHFYGPVARRSLGLPAKFAWEGERPATPTSRRWRKRPAAVALALLQVGQPARAKRSCAPLVASAHHPGLVRAMLGVATLAGLDGLPPSSRRVASAERATARLRTLSPAALAAAGGFRSIRRCFNAIALQESRSTPALCRPLPRRPDADVADDRQPRHGRPFLARAGGGAALERAGPLPRTSDSAMSHHLARMDASRATSSPARRLQRGPWQPAEVAAGAWPSRRPVPVHRGVPLEEPAPTLHRVLAYSCLPSRLGPAVPRPRPDRRGRVPALRGAGGGHGHVRRGLKPR